MRLFRIHLNPRSKEARRDLADPYQMHATLCRVFFAQETKCSPNAILWRLEPETDQYGRARLLIQSSESPDWTRVPACWLAAPLSDTDIPVSPGIDLVQRLSLDTLQAGQAFRFRLRANPCKTVQGKRLGLVHPIAQRGWLLRKGEQHGFSLPEPATPDCFDFMQSAEVHTYPDVRISHEQLLKGNQHNGNAISVYSVLFEGFLTVTDPAQFRVALKSGIGHGKVMGLGLLSVAPSTR